MTNRLGLALLIAASASYAEAQDPSASKGAGTTAKAGTLIAGVVVDSLHARFLRDADVVIQGANLELRTDSLGRFAIDSLPPGSYQIGVFHPLLDTLNIALASQPFRLGPDSATAVVLAIPSAATLVERMCTGKSRSYGASAITGRVVDPETLAPVPRAEVSLAWAEVEVSKAFGIRQTPRLLRDTTNREGEFTLCGLPSSLRATLQAKDSSAQTGEIPVTLGDRPVEFLARTLNLVATRTETNARRARLSGVVTLGDKQSAAGTRVELEGTEVVAITNEKGEFRMTDLPSGSTVVVARHLGYGSDAVAVDLTSRSEQTVKLTLPKFTAVMDPVLVKARRLAQLDKVGFTQRKRNGFGYYIGPDELERRPRNYVTDILRTVPGLRVTPGLHGDIISSSRSVGAGCMRYYLDDLPYTETEPGDINTFVTAHEIVAVEVYQETLVPPEYVVPGRDCTTVVMWTRFKIRG